MHGVLSVQFLSGSNYTAQRGVDPRKLMGVLEPNIPYNEEQKA